MTQQQHDLCEKVIFEADLARVVGARRILSKPHVVESTINPDGNILATLTYEAYFDLHAREIVENSFRLAIMRDGATSCECGDSQHRRVICKHVIATANVLLAEGGKHE